jgi:lipoprotein-anchoring transpeptidase ErfK/SrfK
MVRRDGAWPLHCHSTPTITGIPTSILSNTLCCPHAVEDKSSTLRCATQNRVVVAQVLIRVLAATHWALRWPRAGNRSGTSGRVSELTGTQSYRTRGIAMKYLFAKSRSAEAVRQAMIATAALAAVIAAPDPAGAERVIEAVASRAAGAPILAIVSLKRQQITVYDADGWILRAPISSGQKGRETPAGVFSVIQKEAEHYSNLYDDASMPHMQRITWSGIALHGGPLPGYPASHGCVRMPYGFAERLFEKTRLGMRVIIAPGDATPVEIAHPALFSPNPEGGAHATALAAQAAEAARKSDEARIAAVTAAREAARAGVPVRRLEDLKTRAEAQLAAAEGALGAALSDEAKARAEDAEAKAAARVAELQSQWDAAKAELQPKLDALAPAREAAVASESARATAAKAASDAARELEPVSVFISRKTQRLYVRRGFEPILESPVTILDADRPIGTHVFTAVARTDTGLRWSVVDLGEGDRHAVLEARARPQAVGARDLEPVPAYASASRSALDRIVIPQEVRDRIASAASPRSSLIISDEALSAETGKGTEFVAVLGNEPQGGLAMRRHGPGPELHYTRLRDRQLYGRSPFGTPFSAW